MSSERSDDFREAFAALTEAKEEKASILAFLEEQFPHEMRRLQELDGEIPSLRDSLKNVLRQYGKSGSYLDYSFTVVKKSTFVVDKSAFIEKAQERGDVEFLLEQGVLLYDINPQQVARLSGEEFAVYSGMVRKEEGTAAVTLPAELKD